MGCAKVHPLHHRSPAEQESARRAAELSGARYRASYDAASIEDAALLADSGDADDRQVGRVLLRRFEDDADLDRRAMLARGPIDVIEFRAERAESPDTCPAWTMLLITVAVVALGIASIGWQVWHP